MITQIILEFSAQQGEETTTQSYVMLLVMCILEPSSPQHRKDDHKPEFAKCRYFSIRHHAELA